jgi:hypothetical protein
LPNGFSAIYNRYSARLRQVYHRSNVGQLFVDSVTIPNLRPTILLVFDSLVACNEHFETSAFEYLEQFAVLQAAPALMGHGGYIMARKAPEQIMGCFRLAGLSMFEINGKAGAYATE